MTTRTSMFFLWLIIAAACLLITGCCSETQNTAGLNQPPLDETYVSRDTPMRTRLSQPYGKLRVPAELFVDLIQPAHASDPVSIIVSASSTVVASSSLITLRIPEIAGEADRTEVLWFSDSSNVISESLKYTMPPLPKGRYHFVAVIELTPDHKGAEPLILSESLYVDIRAEEILSSNVSFRQIERLALYRQLQARAVENLSPGSGSGTINTTGSHYEQMTMLNPNQIEKEIDRLKATDPDIARQIMALNSTEADTESDSGTAERGEQNRPVRERAVPVR
jgi:hypothetical protein